MPTTAELETTQRIDPLEDPRWDEFLATHPRSSVFHSRPWLESLRRTYGFRVHAYTTSLPGEKLSNAAVFCVVDSWLSGRRLVSLPFSDHCEWLVDDNADRETLFSAIEVEYRREKFLYVEMRPTSRFQVPTALICSAEELCLHQIDLRPDLATLFQNLHRGSTRRKIQRAERENLAYEEGTSESLLESFWELTILTRRRHGLPPQPRRWFRNLIDCFGESLKIMVAYSNNHAVASILVLRHKDSLIYKYGCSDAHFHNLGGMHLLLWRAIQGAKKMGLKVFDLGRSNIQNTGLILFKERWGAQRSPLTYLTFSPAGSVRGASSHPDSDWRLRYARRIFTYAPDSFLSLVGNALYKHIA